MKNEKRQNMEREKDLLSDQLEVEFRLEGSGKIDRYRDVEIILTSSNEKVWSGSSVNDKL